MVWFLFFACGSLVFPNTSYWRDSLFPMIYWLLCHKLIDLICLGLFLASPFIMSVFMPMPYCFDCYSFLILYEITVCDASSFVLSQYGFEGSLLFHTNFEIVLCLWKMPDVSLNSQEYTLSCFYSFTVLVTWNTAHTIWTFSSSSSHRWYVIFIFFLPPFYSIQMEEMKIQTFCRVS